VLLLSLAGSLYHSLHVDFQAQGRYLFGALPAVAMMWAGTASWERGVTGSIRTALTAAMYALSIGTLLFMLIFNPALR
jgi:hypothetical protein